MNPWKTPVSIIIGLVIALFSLGLFLFGWNQQLRPRHITRCVDDLGYCLTIDYPPSLSVDDESEISIEVKNSVVSL
jgi:hypothetical protein